MNAVKGGGTFTASSAQQVLARHLTSLEKDQQSESLLERLSPRERQVFALLADGKKIQDIAQQVSLELQLRFKGIDASPAPSLKKDESIAFAYEKLGLGKFGHSGTLAISAIITRALKNLSIKTCGYSGLMLPVCEDFGLAQRAGERTYNLTNLLLYSAVCGCGLDVLPLPGDIEVDEIRAILLDVATLAIRLNKPLSARLLPAPGKKVGEMTTFNSPYLVDCITLDV
jgi:hypothetical protein